jgi:hypothetical protein
MLAHKMVDLPEPSASAVVTIRADIEPVGMNKGVVFWVKRRRTHIGRMIGDSMNPESADVFMEAEGETLYGRRLVADHGERVLWGERFDLGNSGLLK